MRILILAVLCVVSCCAQAVRVDPLPSTTISNGGSQPYGYPQVLAIPGAAITLCGYPANGFPCTNLATAYTDATEATACAAGSPVVLAGSSTCSSSSDQQGNFGFWLDPGQYTYMLTIKGVTYGPYPITAPGDFIPPVSSVLLFGCKGDGITNDYPCFVAAFASGKSLYVPDGTYLINLSGISAPWSPPMANRSVTFDPNAKWLVRMPTDTSIPTAIYINGQNNFLWDNFRISLYSGVPTTPCLTSLPSYCTTMLGINGSTGVTLNNLNIDSAQSIAFIAGNNTNLVVNGLKIGPSAGTIFNGDQDLSIDHMWCAVVFDDCLNVTSEAASGTTHGAVVHDLQVAGSWSRGLLLAGPGITVSGCRIRNTQVDGIGIENKTIYGQVETPDNVVVTGCIIENVRNTGQATDPTYPKAGIDIDGDIAIGKVTLTGNIIRNSDGPGIMARQTVQTDALVLNGNLVDHAGNAVSPPTDGSCYSVTRVLHLTAANNACEFASGSGWMVEGVNTGWASITGGSIHDANGATGANRAIQMIMMRSFAISGVSIVDDRSTALSYIVSANGTIVSGSFSDIVFDIEHPGTGQHPVLYTDTGLDTFNNFALNLANIGVAHIPADGSRGACVDCDPPASQGVACTSAGAKTGAVLQMSGGVQKCY